jgi:microcystin-dependent protein
MKNFKKITTYLASVAMLFSLTSVVNKASAGADPFIGEITMFAGNYAPRGWAFCHGQSLSISQNQTLYSLLGTTYGGNGVTNFFLPDLRGRVAIGSNRVPDSSKVRLGKHGGVEKYTLSSAQLPTHSHVFSADVSINIKDESNGDTGKVDDAKGFASMSNGRGTEILAKNINKGLNAGVVTGETTLSGESQSINNMQPYLVLNYIIALEGIYPPRP